MTETQARRLAKAINTVDPKQKAKAAFGVNTWAVTQEHGPTLYIHPEDEDTSR